MTRPIIRAALALALVAATGVGAGAADPKPTGYLAADAFDVIKVIPPAPTIGDDRAAADRAIFRRTRALKGTPRWALATSDVEETREAMMRDFSCAAGITLTPALAPATVTLVRRAAVDTSHQTNAAKKLYQRLRPYHFDPGPTCEPIRETEDSYDYPSGHTTYGWTWATLLAWSMPDRATPILARGRAFGESRLVCGVHNASAVEAGRLSASATLDAMAGLPAFQADLAAARAELARLSADPATPRPAPAACAAEAVLVAQRVD